MKQEKIEKIVNEAIGFIHIMSEGTVSEKEGKRVIKRLRKVKFCNLHVVNASNSEITWALLENKDFENSFAMERLGINKNTIISIESDPEGDDNYKMVYYWR